MDNPITAVRARLGDGRLWAKHTCGPWGDPGGYGSVCLMGAFYSVYGLEGRRDRQRCWDGVTLVGKIAREQFPEVFDHEPIRYSGKDAVIFFNDSRATAWKDVDLVLGKAEVAWEEQHG